MLLDAVVNFEVPDELLVKRICGRRVHPASGRTHHVDFAPPKRPGVDDVSRASQAEPSQAMHSFTGCMGWRVVFR